MLLLLLLRKGKEEAIVDTGGTGKDGAKLAASRECGLPFEGFRLEPDARSPSPTTVLPLMEFTALQGLDMRSTAGGIGFPGPGMPSLFPTGLPVSIARRPPLAYAYGFIPS
jgi:hypothetical protein